MAVLPDLRRPEADLMPDQPIPPEAAQVAAQIAGRHYLAAYHGGRECPIPNGAGLITVTPFINNDEGRFLFRQSDPNVVLAIGRLLIAAARKAGATDA